MSKRTARETGRLRSSGGFGFADFYRRGKKVEKITGTVSASYTVSVGYDFFIKKKKPYQSGGVAVSPMIWINAANGIVLHTLAGGFAVEISLWTGLDKNRLALPTNQAF